MVSRLHILQRSLKPISSAQGGSSPLPSFEICLVLEPRGYCLSLWPSLHSEMFSVLSSPKADVRYIFDRGTEPRTNQFFSGSGSRTRRHPPIFEALGEQQAIQRTVHGIIRALARLSHHYACSSPRRCIQLHPQVGPPFPLSNFSPANLSQRYLLSSLGCQRLRLRRTHLSLPEPVFHTPQSANLGSTFQGHASGCCLFLPLKHLSGCCTVCTAI
jgi:hypothetical protein